MNNKKDLLLDVDEVIVFSGFLEAVNAFLNTSYEIDDFKDYYIDSVAIPPERMGEFNNFLRSWNLYKDASPLPHATEVLKRLSKYFNIYILTSCVNEHDIEGSGKIFLDKYTFLVNALPFINPKNFIFTGSKHLFKAYAKIDDLITNFSPRESIEVKILFPSYHNKDISDNELNSMGITRAGFDWRTGWLEVEKILMEKIDRDI